MAYKPFKMKAGKEGPMKKNFPDLSGDGKVTQKDVLMGKGVIPSPNKKRGCKSAYKKMKPCAGCKSICSSCKGGNYPSAMKNYKKGYYGA